MRPPEEEAAPAAFSGEQQIDCCQLPIYTQAWSSWPDQKRGNCRMHESERANLSATAMPPGVLQQAGASGYVVHLPVFEGPLELLLHLIEQRRMEITTISLVAVTDQYLEYLRHHQADELPLANMAAFVSIAARLLFIKSQSLLPRAPRQEPSEEARRAAELAEELQRHLLEYRIAKEIAEVLRRRAEAGLQTYGRSSLLAGIEAQLAWTPPRLVGLESEALARAFRRLLLVRRAEEQAETGLLPPAHVQVGERMAAILAQLRERPRILLSELFAPGVSRLVMVVTFLAMLELWKHERISVAQERLFGPLALERGTRWQEELPPAQSASPEDEEQAALRRRFPSGGST
jgi:segregation and condensation protein A